MDAIKINKDKIILELSKDELSVLNNDALNEVCNGIEMWELDTRTNIRIIKFDFLKG